MGKRILVAGAGLTAAAQLLQGEVYVPESVDGRRMADKLYGYVHPCCSFPLSDVALNVPPMPFSQGFEKRSEARRCRGGKKRSATQMAANPRGALPLCSEKRPSASKR